MALSACRLAWVCQSPGLEAVARRYQETALNSVQKDLRNLGIDNSDAILSTLILLSTEVDDRYGMLNSPVELY